MLDFLQRPVQRGALAEPAQARREVEGPSLELLRSVLLGEATEQGAAAPEASVFGAAAQAGAEQRQGDDTPARETRNPTYTAGVYNKHAAQIDGTDLNLGRHAWSVNRLQEIWAAHQARYEAVAAQVDLPAELIAALHFRESSGDFNTYLHQGDPLGRPAVNHPSNIPVFHVWEDAAVHALSDRHKAGIQDDLDITEDTQDLAALATYAEYYNGLGYHNRDRVSPYVYSGTDHYTGGKYVRDGVFSSTAVDQQLGVLAMVQVLRGEADGPMAGPDLALGDRTLRDGLRGNDVRELQTLLNGHGAGIVVDGDFGRGTTAAVRQFQQDNGLDVDGVVGPGTVAALRANPGMGQTDERTEDTGPVADDQSRDDRDSDVPVPEPNPLRTLDLGTGLLRQGSRGEGVRALQQALVYLGQRIAVDGIFGRGTREAVRWFQRSRGLSPDGVVGPATRAALQGG